MYNAAVAPSVAQANQFVGLLEGKADKTQIVTPKAYIVETWRSGTSWYRKYSDGWIEQGGLTESGNDILVTFPKSFSDTNYTALVTSVYGARVDGYNAFCGHKATANMRVYNKMIGSDAKTHIGWYACGY